MHSRIPTRLEDTKECEEKIVLFFWYTVIRLPLLSKYVTIPLTSYCIFIYLAFPLPFCFCCFRLKSRKALLLRATSQVPPL